MQVFVNANKKGQDKHVALTIRVGQFVKMQFNANKKAIEFYRREGYLGSTSSNIKIEGYAQVKKIESLFKGFHFTMEYEDTLTEDIAIVKEKMFFDNEKIRKENIRLDIHLEQKTKSEKLKIKNNKVITDEEILKSSFFRDLLKRYEFSKCSNKNSIQTNVSELFTLLKIVVAGDSMLTEEDIDQKWWRDQLIKYRDTPYGERLFHLNEAGELVRIVKKLILSYPKSHRINNYSERITRCWRCGTTLMSKTHNKCTRCNWLICSCGACTQGCSK